LSTVYNFIWQLNDSKNKKNNKTHKILHPIHCTLIVLSTAFSSFTLSLSLYL
jgi:hypothetical protein